MNYIKKNWKIILMLLILVSFSIYLGCTSYNWQKKFYHEQFISDHYDVSSRLLIRCIDSADQGYSQKWDEACIKGGHEKDCFLGVSLSDPILSERLNNIAQCVNSFGKAVKDFGVDLKFHS